MTRDNQTALHARCGGGDRFSCPCYRSGAAEEAEMHRARPATREITDYIRAIGDGDPTITTEDMAENVCRVFAPDLLDNAIPNAGRLAQALCEHAQTRGYDHGKNPTMMFSARSCPRHLIMANEIIGALTKSIPAETEDTALIPNPETYGGEMFNIGYRAALNDLKKNGHV